MTTMSKEYAREYKRKRRMSLEFREKELERNKEWRDNNKEKQSIQKKEYYLKNKERIVKKRATEHKERKMRNVKFSEELTDFVEKEAKNLIELRNKVTGIRWSLDHILPLRGKTVSGLHVWNNLQVIPLAINKQKYNKHEEDCIRY